MRLPNFFLLVLVFIGLNIHGASSEETRKQEVERIRQRIEKVRSAQRKELAKSLLGFASSSAAMATLWWYMNKFGGQLWYRPTLFLNLYTTGLGFFIAANSSWMFALKAFIDYNLYPSTFSSIEELDKAYEELIPK